MKSLISKTRNSKVLQKSIFYVLVFLVFAYFFSVPSFGGRPGFNYIVYATLALLAVFTFLNCFLRKTFLFNRSLLLIPLFAVFALIGTALYSHDFRGWATMLLLSISFYVLYYSFVSIKKKELIFNIIVAGIFAYSVYYLIHYRNEILNFSSFGSEAFRLGTFFDNQNDVAMCCIIGFSFSLYQFLFCKGKIKFIYLVPLLSIFVVGLTTGSRTFVIASLLLIVLLSFFRLIHHKLLFLIVLVSLIAVFFVLINIPFMDTLRERLLKMITTFFTDSATYDYSSISRTIWFDYGFALGSKNVIFGYGYAGFSIFSGVGTFTHSNVTEVFCDFGLIGLLIFYSPYLFLLIEAFKKRNKSLNFLIPLFIVFIVLSFSTVFFYNKMYYALMAVCFYIVLNDFFVPKEKDNLNTAPKILVVLDTNDKQNPLTTQFISDVKSVYTASTIKTVVFVNNFLFDENQTLLSKATSKPLRILFLHRFLKKNKFNIVISFDEKHDIFVQKSITGLDVLHIPVVIHENELVSKTKKNSFPRIALVKTDGGDMHKEDFYVNPSDLENLRKTLLLLEQKQTEYENTFNWK